MLNKENTYRRLENQNCYGGLQRINNIPDASGPPPIDLTYSSNGDTNGLFYYIGTDALSSGWVNPITSGAVISSASTYWPDSAYSTPSVTVDRGASALPFHSGGGYTDNWLMYDLGALIQMKVTDYTILGRSDATLPMLRVWNLEGSNDGSSWSVIDSRVDAQQEQNVWGYYSVSGSTKYRYLRIRSTGTQSGGDYSLCYGEIEFYGQLYDV